VTGCSPQPGGKFVARKIRSDADGQTFTKTMHLYPTFDLTHAPASMENAGKRMSHRTTKVVCIVQVSIGQVDSPSHIKLSRDYIYFGIFMSWVFDHDFRVSPYALDSFSRCRRRSYLAQVSQTSTKGHKFLEHAVL